MAGILKWYGTEVYNKIQAEQKSRVQKAAIFLESYIKKSFGKSPSKAGEPPGVDTGRLRNSITHEIDTVLWDIIGRVGTNVEYARRLELGFHDTDSKGRHVDQAPRPYLRRAIEENKQELINILSGRII